MTSGQRDAANKLANAVMQAVADFSDFSKPYIESENDLAEAIRTYAREQTDAP